MKTLLRILILFTLLVNRSYAQVSPLTIAQFDGQPLSNHATFLEWKTMMEMKVAYYTIQRSSDGIRFSDLAMVNSKMSDSTSIYELDYSYTDQSPLPGTSYYRLQVVDRNGFSNYSDVIRISNMQTQGIKLFPTVIQSNTLFVETDKTIKSVKLEIFDFSGRKISETDWETLSGRQNLPVTNSSAMLTGTYLARLSSQGETLVSQLLIIQSR